LFNIRAQRKVRRQMRRLDFSHIKRNCLDLLGALPVTLHSPLSTSVGPVVCPSPNHRYGVLIIYTQCVMLYSVGVAARARMNAISAAAPASKTADDLLTEMLLQNQRSTESDVHVYQTPRRQQSQQQTPVASL